MPSPEEWADIEMFMQANSPVRLEMLKRIEGDLGEDHRVARAARRRVAQRYRDLEQLRSRGPDMHTFALRQLQIEDEVLRTMRAQRSSNADQPALEKELDRELRSFVENYLGERHARIERLKQIVERETANLERDRASTDSLVAAQREKFKKEMEGLLEFDAKRAESESTTMPNRDTPSKP